MAHKKGMGSTRNGRDSEAKRLGVKKFGGETVKAGLYSGVPAVFLRERKLNNYYKQSNLNFFK